MNLHLEDKIELKKCYSPLKPKCGHNLLGKRSCKPHGRLLN